MYSMTSPEMYREMSPPSLGYVFVPDDDTFLNTDHYLEIQFVTFGPQSEQPFSATAWISPTTHDEPEPLKFEPVVFQGEPRDKWIALLPQRENKADRWFYYITIETSEGRTIEIWKDMNWFEKFFSGFKKEHQHFWVTYEGSVSREMPAGKLVLVTHIVFSFGALLFMFHTLYYMMSIFSGAKANNFIKAYKSAFWAVMMFFVGAILLGIPITWFTFGVGFQPWPTQGLTSLGDVTDTKSTWLVIAWGILLGCYYRVFKNALSQQMEYGRFKSFAYWIIVALIFTIFVFLIPHSQFMQAGQ